MSNTTRILVALVAGLVLGAMIGAAGPAWAGDVLAVARPIGKLWLDALQMTIVPLVFALLVTGVASAAGTAAGGGVAARSIGLFAVLLLAAALLGAFVSPLLLDLVPVSADSAAAIRGGGAVGQVPPIPPMGEWLLGFIPSNPVKAAAEAQMVPLVLFALTFGLAVTRLAEEKKARIVGLFDAVKDAMFVIVHWVLLAAPVGVFALALNVGGTAGLGVAGTLLHYVALVVATLLVLLLATYILAVVAGRIAPRRFARGVLPCQIVGFSTQSSLATLPAMLEATGQGLGVSEALRGTVLPLAVSLFRMTSPAGNMAVAVFAAKVSGMDLGMGQLIVGALVAALISLAAVGLPSQLTFFITLGPIFLAMGVPLEILPILLAVETLPDLFRTVGNVTADMAVTRIVAVRVGAGE